MIGGYSLIVENYIVVGAAPDAQLRGGQVEFLALIRTILDLFSLNGQWNERTILCV